MDALRRPDLDKVHAQFEAWRAAGHARRAFPERLWRAAVGLLDRYPSSVVCRRLRLNATRLARVREALGATRAGGAAAFVELPALHALAAPTMAGAAAVEGTGPRSACRVVLEPATGGRLSVELARVDAAWLEVVCRSLLAASAGLTARAYSVPWAGAGVDQR
jgi:hypothetical protein